MVLGLAARFERLVPDLAVTFVRFPVPAALSLALAAYVNIAGASSDHDGQVIAGAASAFIAAGAAHLFAKGWKLSRPASLLIAIAAAVAAAILGYLQRVFSTNLLFLFAGLLPLLMIAPYLHAHARQGAIWLFNLRLGLAALLAAVVALLFAAGLSAIVEALDILFGVSTGNLHEHIWSTAMALVAPLYGLSLMPRKLDEEVDISPHSGSLLDRGISVLVNYVAVPVIAAYALILHAYAVKIVIEGELPKGQIGTMVTIFAIGGTATWLIAWPWREQGTKLLRLFMGWWFFLLIVPAVLLSLGIWRRLSDYGVTPDRYGIALVAIWVAALVVYLAIRRTYADMRAILGTVGVLLLMGAVGPMGANGLTASSQYTRLVTLLERNGVLRDGKLLDHGLLPSEAASSGTSMVYALREVAALDRLEPWFKDRPNSPFASGDRDWTLAQALNERLGFHQPTMSADFVSFNANIAASLDLPPGARLLGPFQSQPAYDNIQQQPMTALHDKENVRIKLVDVTLTVTQKRLLEEAKSRLFANPMSQEPFTVEVAPGVTMMIDQISGNLAATAAPLHGLRFWLIRQPVP